MSRFEEIEARLKAIDSERLFIRDYLNYLLEKDIRYLLTTVETLKKALEEIRNRADKSLFQLYADIANAALEVLK